MISLLRRMLNLDTVDTLLSIGQGYQEVAREQQEQIDGLLELVEEYKIGQRRQHLAHTKALRDLVEHFFIVQEAGIDVRDELEAGLRDLQDEVARQEEHAPR